MSKLLQVFCIYFCVTCSIFAAVPTVDINQANQDSYAIGVYATSITQTMSKLSQAIDVTSQLRQLKSLQQLSSSGDAICKLCSQSEQQQLQTYINQVNDDLCKQFSNALQNMLQAQQNVRTIQDIVTMFSSNPKEASLALQAASIQTQSTIQTTLTQIQALQAQQIQKQLAEQKIGKDTEGKIYAGFRNLGL